jgi:hypothetical protein
VRRNFLGCMFNNLLKFVKLVMYMQIKVELMVHNKTLVIQRCQSVLKVTVSEEEKAAQQKWDMDSLTRKMTMCRRMLSLLYLKKLCDHGAAVSMILHIMGDILSLWTGLDDQSKTVIKEERLF